MARSKITATTQDVVSDDGGVLLSLVRGEAQEFPVVLNFLTNASSGYTYEAVVVEALNAVDGSKPTTIQPSGTKDTLTVRVCTNRGTWVTGTLYDREQFVFDATDQNYYKLTNGQTGWTSTTAPHSDLANWTLFDPRTVYVQLPTTLGAGYAQTPTAEYPIYGFFELQVTEPAGGVFQRSWKPVRGLVEILFSPTFLVP